MFKTFHMFLRKIVGVDINIYNFLNFNFFTSTVLCLIFPSHLHIRKPLMASRQMSQSHYYFRSCNLNILHKQARYGRSCFNVQKRSKNAHLYNVQVHGLAVQRAFVAIEPSVSQTVKKKKKRGG